MASAQWQRRQFLKALGGTAASLPFLSLLDSSVVQADTPRPMRVMFIYQAWGGVWDYLRPRGLTLNGNEAALTADSINFQNSALAPLAPYLSQMLVVEGLALTTGLLNQDDSQPMGDTNARTLYIGHDHTAPNMWTGATVTDGTDYLPTGPSLDFVLGQQANTPVRNIQLAMGGYVDRSQYESFSYNASGQRLPGFGSPADTLRVLFGNGTGTMPTNPAADTAKKKSVLAAVQASATRMRARLATPERSKLDEHLAALSDIESRLNNTAPPVMCGQPATPSGANDIASVTTDQMTLVREAFACDVTRYVTAGWNVGGDPIPGVLDPSITDLHGQVAHMVDAAGTDGETAALNVAKMQNWHAQKLADFMGTLAQTPDGSGTLLDNTLIVWAQDFGQDVHGGLNVPFVLLGGAQKKFRMGRYLRVATAYDNDFAESLPWKNYVSHNKLLVSIMNACGVAGDTFGSTEISGPLTGLT